MKIAITELRVLVEGYFISIGLTKKDAATFTELIVQQELLGNQFSAVGELRGKHSKLTASNSAVEPEVVVDKPSAMLVKGNGRAAPLITSDYLDTAVDKAKKQGIYAFAIYDSTYNDFFDVFCRRVASQDCILLLFENGGPQGVVPFGGRKDITGTNPIAYGIPTNNDPIVFDAATAMHAYGLMRQAKELGIELPDNAYVDKNGDITTNPNESFAVLPFGGFKGWGINLLVDVLSGALVRGRSGLDQPADSQRYIGTFMIIIDPSCFGEIADFKDSTTKLVEDILASPSVDPGKPVRVPGIRGAKKRAEALETGFIDIPDHEWEKFRTV